MASSGQLIDCVARATGISPATVAIHDRALVDAGLRKVGGRGRSAAKVTTIDAGRLLIAIISAPISGPAISNSAENCKLYADLKPRVRNGRRQRWPKRAPAALRNLPADHTLLDAVAALIAARGLACDDRPRWKTKVELRAPRLTALILCVDRFGGYYGVDYDTGSAPTKPEIGDVYQERGFTEYTLAKVGELLGDCADDKVRAA